MLPVCMRKYYLGDFITHRPNGSSRLLEKGLEPLTGPFLYNLRATPHSNLASCRLGTDPAFLDQA